MFIYTYAYYKTNRIQICIQTHNERAAVPNFYQMWCLGQENTDLNYRLF